MYCVLLKIQFVVTILHFMGGLSSGKCREYYFYDVFSLVLVHFNTWEGILFYFLAFKALSQYWYFYKKYKLFWDKWQMVEYIKVN